MPPPRFLVCYLCGQQFGSASLKIHQNQCYTKKLAQWSNEHPSERGPRPVDPETMRARQQQQQQQRAPPPQRAVPSTKCACGECGAPYKAGAKFCQECGTKIQQQQPAAAATRQRQARPAASAQQQIDTYANQEALDMFLTPCKNCGRKFNPDRVKRHEAACMVANKKRKAFDSHKHRVQDTDMVGNQQTYKRDVVQKRGQQQKPSKWKLQHREFQSAIKNARQMSGYVARGGDVRDLPPPPPTVNHDYVQCPYCTRSFAPDTAERHIPRCKTTQNRPKPPGGRAVASSYSQPQSRMASSRTSAPRVGAAPTRRVSQPRATQPVGRTPPLSRGGGGGGGGGAGYPDPKSNTQTFSLFGGPTDLPQVSNKRQQPVRAPAAQYGARQPTSGGGRIVNSNQSSSEMMRAMGGGYY